MALNLSHGPFDSYSLIFTNVLTINLVKLAEALTSLKQHHGNSSANHSAKVLIFLNVDSRAPVVRR